MVLSQSDLSPGGEVLIDSGCAHRLWKLAVGAQLNLPLGPHVNRLCEDTRGSQSPPPHLIMFDWCPLHPLTCSSVGGTQQIPHSAVSYHGYLRAVTCLTADWHGWCPWSLLRSWTLCLLAGVIWAEWLAILETTVCTGFADTGQLGGCLANSHMTSCGDSTVDCPVGPSVLDTESGRQLSISLGFKSWRWFCPDRAKTNL